MTLIVIGDESLKITQNHYYGRSTQFHEVLLWQLGFQCCVPGGLNWTYHPDLTQWAPNGRQLFLFIKALTTFETWIEIGYCTLNVRCIRNHNQDIQIEFDEFISLID